MSNANGEATGLRRELNFAILSGFFLATGFSLSFFFGLPTWVPLAAYLFSYFFGGFYTTKEAYQAIRHGGFEIDFLMLVAAVGAAFLNKWAEGALLLFLFSLGHALEHYALNRARKSISALADLTPPTALLLKNGEQIEVSIEDLSRGDTILVKPNSKIAADGVVSKGQSAVNEASITGESLPVEKIAVGKTSNLLEFDQVDAQHRVFAGSINGNQVLEVKVLRPAEDSTIARLIQLIKEAEKQKSPTQQFTDRVEKYYVPLVLISVIILLFAFVVLDEEFSQSFYRAMSVLVAASPCALAISTPSAVLAGIARAARSGVLVKGGRPLEDLGELGALAFDKTGTLTEGKPRLTDVVPAEGVPEKELLRIAVAVENQSNHPLAAAICEGGKARLGNNSWPEVSDLDTRIGRGVQAKIDGKLVAIGNRRLMEEIAGQPLPEPLSQKMNELESTGHTSMLVWYGGQLLGLLAVMDLPRPEAAETLGRLKKIGLKKMVMLTGDHQRVADAVAAQIGITDPMGSLLPEDKVAAIEQLRKETGNVAMVGDGVNDAPAMAKSTVGIAMGAAGSDVALDTADIALMGDQLSRLPFAIALSRKTKRIIRQNLWISLGMVAILVPLTILGIAEIGPAVIGHEGSTLVVVLNALRLLGFKEIN